MTLRFAMLVFSLFSLYSPPGFSVARDQDGDSQELCDAADRVKANRLQQFIEAANKEEEEKCKDKPHDLTIGGAQINRCTNRAVKVLSCCPDCGNGGGERRPASDNLSPLKGDYQPLNIPYESDHKPGYNGG